MEKTRGKCKVKIRQLSTRQIYLIIFLAVGGLIGYAAYSIKILGLEPCPLFVTQQFFYSIVGITAFIAFNHNPVSTISRFYAAIISLASAAGIWVAGRQVWLQSLPEDEVPLCGPPLEYILEVFPFGDLLTALFMGDGNCAEISWQFLGLSMAGWSLIWFALFLVLSILVILKSRSIHS